MSDCFCPNCEVVMVSNIEPDLTREVCPRCHGVYLANESLANLIDGGSQDFEYWATIIPLDQDLLPSRKCPGCEQGLMNKIKLPYHTESIYDYCSNCGGIFFDRQECEEVEQIDWGENYRGYIDNHLVKINTSRLAHLNFSPGKGYSYAQGSKYLSLKIYFIQSLNLGLHLTSEKVKHKIMKFLGMFNQQDIEVGEEQFDTRFLIKGQDVSMIKKLLGSEEVGKALLRVMNKKNHLFARTGFFKMTDHFISYSEGPYSTESMVPPATEAKLRYDVQRDPEGLVGKMLQTVKLIEKVFVVLENNEPHPGAASPAASP